MSKIRVAKTSPKLFISDQAKIKKLVTQTMSKISAIVGSTFGPSGRNCLIESELPSIPHKNTKDGVTVFKSLGAFDPFEHLIIEQARDCATKTATEAGDGPQPLWSKILTPTGFVTMGEIKEGVEICGTNQSVQKVLGVFPKGQKEIWEVEFSDGRVVECCADHLWQVSYNNESKAVKTTASLKQDFKTNNSGFNKYKYYTPKTVVEFEENKKEMPLHPYLVGVLLGDGSLSEDHSIEISLGVPKKHILDKLNLPKGIYAETTFIEAKNYYRVRIRGKDENGKTIKELVQSIGLLGTYSNSKFIPKSYLYSSQETREQLLQGLLDTDGHYNVRDRFEYSTVSEELYNDFMTLTQSLGISTHSYLMDRKENSSYSNTSIYRVVELKGYKMGDKIINITPTGKFTEMQCIKVSNPDNLYITDNFIVTHNTTSSTILAASLIENLYEYCDNNKHISPQKVSRELSKIVRERLVPSIKNKAIDVSGEEGQGILHKVAKVSANGDEDMADAVIQAFETIGFGDSSHVTIRELSGPYGYKVEKIEGFPIGIGYEESMGKFHTAFINDQANQRCVVENPLFILYDGHITDFTTVQNILNKVGDSYTAGNENHKNVVLVAHGYGESLLTQCAINFANPNTINIIPITTKLEGFINAQLEFLMDVSAFTGAAIFGLHRSIATAEISNLGNSMSSIEVYRFRSTIVGEADPANIEIRVSDLETRKENAASQAEKIWLEERLGKITGGIAKLTVMGSSRGELGERRDRVEDAVLAVRSAISKGALAGGCRVWVDLATELMNDKNSNEVAQQVIVPSLLSLPARLLENAGYSETESQEILETYMDNPDVLFDVENQAFGTAEELGVFDCLPAVEEALVNATSLATVLGAMSGLVCSPRDGAFERAEAGADLEWDRTINNAHLMPNEANGRM